MKESLIKEKSFQFAIRTVKMYSHLKEAKKEYVMSKQVLRSGTSIGANIREALNGESKADFIHKLAIAQKEADETLYWLELLKATEFIDDTSYHFHEFRTISMNRNKSSFIYKFSRFEQF